MSSFFKSLLILSWCGLLAAQTPVFKQGAAIGTQPGPLASVTGDFNHDGHPDIAIANTAVQSISILLGNGDGTFRLPVVYHTNGCQPGQLVLGDFNGDGQPDILTSCTLTNNIIVLPGHADGTFATPVFSPTPFPVVSGFLDGFVEPLTAADVNGDGILDLALIIQTAQSVGFNTPGAIGQAVIMNGRGDGTFTLASTLSIAPTGTQPYALQLADVNGDGKADIVGISFSVGPSGLVSPLTAFLFVATGNGAGAFQFAHSYPLTGIPQTGMMLADINGDGKTDVVFAGLSIAAILNDDETDFSGVGVFLGAGDGSFTRGYTVVDSQSVVNQATVGSALAPILGSKFPDIVGVMFSQPLSGSDTLTGSVVVRPNHGDGTFGAPENLIPPSSSLPFSVAVADFNSDGKPDLVTFDFNVNLLELLFTTSDIFDQIDTIGQGIATFPAGAASILLNQTASSTPVPTFTDTNAANYQAGAVATSSIVTAFGAGLATGIDSASGLPLPTALGGASITVTDSLGVARSAPLFYVSPTQINYAIPDGTAVNTATITIHTPTGAQTAQQSIVSTAPGLFNVSGVAVAQVYTYAGGSSTPVVTSTVGLNAQSQFAPAPIALDSGTTVFLILYGTGIRNHSGVVNATIGTTVIATAFAGAQGSYVGEDQINIQLPSSLKGAGAVSLTLNVDGQTTNAVQLTFP